MKMTPLVSATSAAIDLLETSPLTISAFCINSQKVMKICACDLGEVVGWLP